MNYFVVDTAFQMLCAIEARDALARGQDNRLVIEARGAEEGRELNLAQIRALDDGQWGDVILSPYPRHRGARRSLARVANLARIVARHGRGNRVFIGTYSAKWAAWTARALGRHRIRIDDGIGSLTLVEDLRRTGGAAGPEPVLFTLFQRAGDGPGVVHNDFATLRARAVAGQWRDGGLTWLVGGAYGEAGVIPEDEEVAIFAGLARRLAAPEVCYLPHRADRPEKLARLAALGLTVVEPGPTLEARLCATQRLPARLGGIISTVLFTTRRLQPDIRVTAVRMESPAREWFPMAYALAGDFGITVVDPDPGQIPGSPPRSLPSG